MDIGPLNRVGSRVGRAVTVTLLAAAAAPPALAQGIVPEEYPERNPAGARAAPFTGNYPTTNYFQNYSSFSPFGFNGRYLYGRVNYRWLTATAGACAPGTRGFS